MNLKDLKKKELITQIKHLESLRIELEDWNTYLVKMNARLMGATVTVEQDPTTQRRITLAEVYDFENPYSIEMDWISLKVTIRV